MDQIRAEADRLLLTLDHEMAQLGEVPTVIEVSSARRVAMKLAVQLAVLQTRLAR